MTTERKDASPLDKSAYGKSAQSQRMAKQRADILKMRLAGMTWRQIAEAVGKSVATVHQQGMEELHAAIGDVRSLREETLALEMQRLDQLFLMLWSDVMTTTDRDERNKLVDRVLRIMERRSKLLGLDAPIDIHTDDAQAVHDFMGRVLGSTEAHELLGQLADMMDEQQSMPEALPNLIDVGTPNGTSNGKHP